MIDGTSRSSANDEKDAIRRVIDDAQKYQGDLERFVALHAEEGMIVNLAGRRVQGLYEIREAMASALATPLADVITTIDVDDIQIVAADVAIVACTKYVHDRRDRDEATRATPAFPQRGRLTYVMVRRDDAWRIALAQTTPILAA